MIHGILFKTPKFWNCLQALEDNSNALLLNPAHQRLMTCLATPQCWLAQATDKTDNALSLTSLGQPPCAVITAWARLDNREELAERLFISSQSLQTLSSAELILQAYLQFGEACTEYLIGDFCFAIYDYTTQHLFCARDHMGIKPFYYYEDKHLVVFSSSLVLFHQLPGLSIKPSLEWASRFLLNRSMEMDFEKTAYAHVFKLPPAHQLSITPDTLTKKQYFSFHTNKLQLNTSADYVDYYQHHLDTAIKCRVQVEHPLGSELSGGIDSSTVTAYAAKHYQGSLSDFHTFGFVHFAEEPKHLLSVNQHLNIPMGYVCCNTSLFQADPTREFKALGAPAQHGNTFSHEIFYVLMEKNLGVKTLLSGFGGDEFVTSIHGHLVLHELMNNRQYTTLYQYLVGNPVMRALRFLKFSYNHVRQSGVQSTHMADAFAGYWPFCIVSDELIQMYGLKAIHDNHGKFDQGYRDLDRFTLEKCLAPYISTRTEEGTLMAATYGIDYRWPLLDVRLIQCFLSIPSTEKYYRGVGRYLHKRAIKNILPSNVTEQHSKYMGERITSRPPCKLNEDLHPALLKLINKPKLLAQQKQYMEHITSMDSLHEILISQNIRRVNQIDHWLKHYFADGVDWA